MASSRATRLRSEQYNSNVTKRGRVNSNKDQKEKSSRVGPVLLGFFMFVVFGSAIFQILQNMSRGPIF